MRLYNILSSLAAKINKTTLVNKYYPVGSIYRSTVSTNPSTLFGGTWVQIKDSFLLAAGSSYSAGSTGGSSTHNHTEGDLTAACGASGSNPNIFSYVAGSKSSRGPATVGQYTLWHSYVSGTRTFNHYTKCYGTTAGSSSLPPYLVVYTWKRTA